mmetsp:Transcript_15092/g.51764  ORF Transcript_15092/g.51764 Transcript_15092/m.51764 type:complete len:235 (+) Transcript_15092:874-1578(+)
MVRRPQGGARRGVHPPRQVARLEKPVEELQQHAQGLPPAHHRRLARGVVLPGPRARAGERRAPRHGRGKKGHLVPRRAHQDRLRYPHVFGAHRRVEGVRRVPQTLHRLFGLRRSAAGLLRRGARRARGRVARPHHRLRQHVIRRPSPRSRRLQRRETRRERAPARQELRRAGWRLRVPLHRPVRLQRRPRHCRCLPHVPQRELERDPPRHHHGQQPWRGRGRGVLQRGHHKQEL